MPQRGVLIISLLLKFGSSGFKVAEGRLSAATAEPERASERERRRMSLALGTSLVQEL